MGNMKLQSSHQSSTPAYHWLGLQDYADYLEKMQVYSEKVATGNANEVVWFCEHQPVYTTGKRGIDNRLNNINADLIVTDRGGETTFHGPGQLMMYPILNLKNHHLSVRQYVHLLEESCIKLLSSYGMSAKRECGLPGVWINHQKIVALGIRVSQGVTSHGMALNVHTDLKWFDQINPCGTSKKATSMQAQGTNDIALETLAEQWFNIFTALLENQEP